MSGLTAVRLVAGRELREAFRRRSFWAVIALLLVGSVAAMVAPELVGDDGPQRYDVVLVGDEAGLADVLPGVEEGLAAEIDTEAVDDVATAERRVEDGDADVAIVAGDDPRIIVKAGEHDRLVGAIRQTLASAALAERLEAAGLTPAEVDDVFTVPTPRLLEVAQETGDRRAASFALSLVLYILLISLMVQVANGTAIEKANRIAEVLLAIVRPGALLFGKVLGVGVAGVLTLSAALVPVIVKMLVGGDLPEGIGGALVASAAWFVLGLALYLSIAGALGALVERPEETGSVITPLTTVLVATFLVAQSAADSPLGTVLAYVPLTSPLMAPTRIAEGVSSPTEMAVSLLLLIASVALVARVGSTIYARAIVRTGRRLKVREVLA